MNARLALVGSVLSLAALAAGCDGAPRPEPGDAHDHGDEHGHVHSAPHGGTLVVLAEESANLELVHDRAAGRLTAYVLDGHAEHGVRVPQTTLSLTLRRAGAEAFEVTLVAVSNALTGETVGDTSEFTAADERLRGAGPFEGSVRSVVVRGAAFADVPFRLDGASR
jgi:hypothetical protein